MNMKAIVLISMLYSIVANIASAAYLDELQVIERQRLSNLANTKLSLEKISKHKANFSSKEKYLYLLLVAHSETMHSNFVEAEALLLDIIGSEADVDYKGRAHSILAGVLQFQGKYERSYYHLDKSLGFVPVINNEEYKSSILQNAVSFYNDSGMFDYAMDYARRLLKLGIQRKDLSDQCQAYFEMTLMELSADRHELAVDRLAKTDDICTKANETIFLLHLPNIRADIAIQKGDFTSAKKLLEENYSEVKKYGWKVLNASTEISLANLYSKIGRYGEAEELALKALKVSMEIGDIKRSKGASEILAKIYSELDQKEKAIKYFQMYMELDKRLSASGRQRKLAFDQARQKLKAEQLALVN
ncbi:tetratricopeptide repeat protein [Kangiella taiwanensis]|uniref:MalT-like TPR region domain-containing protein n=1 Tax=Kangiella taiwanensis TaxID=1079179 RepID=A0ABP8HW46_9GAMM|nr:tetratricopeptide repeat protein [Kangiella taiwanensis]